MKDFNSPEYKRSRGAYMTQCTVEYFVSLLVADAFLAKLLTSMGFSDSLAGIVASFTSLAFIIQLMAIPLVRTKFNVKTLVLVFDTLSVCLFMMLYFVPFIPISAEWRIRLIVLGIIGAYFGKYLVISIYFKWGNSYVEPNKRAQYSATKEMISLLTGMGFTAIVGRVVDRYEGLGNINGAFLFLAIALLILNISNFICIALIKKEDERKAEDIPSFADVWKHTVKNKDFRNVITLTILWDMARYFTVGFLGVFKTNDLLLSVFTVQVINIASNFARMIISKPFGRYSDKHSFAKGFRVALYLAAAGFFINMFTTPSTWFFIIAYTILYNCCMAGTNQNSYNITYSYVEEKYISQAMAIKNSIGGLFGFGTALLAGKILAAVQENGNMIFGIHIYGQQLLSGISFAITVIAILFLKNVIEKQNVMIQ